MAEVFLGDTVLIAMQGQVTTTGGQVRKIVNSFTYGILGHPPGWISRLGYATWFNNNVWQGMAGGLPTSYVSTGIFISFPSLAGDVPVNVGVGFSGLQPPPATTVDTCLYANVTTSTRGRYYVGSKRLGPLPQFVVNGDELFPANQANYQVVFNAMLLPLDYTEGANRQRGQPVVWSRQRSAVPYSGGNLFGAIITGVHVNRTLSVWRHRRERTVR